jgi:hypothetical protein
MEKDCLYARRHYTWVLRCELETRVGGCSQQSRTAKAKGDQIAYDSGATGRALNARYEEIL